MADNSNGKSKSSPNALITRDEMLIAFKIAKVLDISKEFGNCSPLGGVVILIQSLTMSILRMEARVSFLETEREKEKDG